MNYVDFSLSFLEGVALILSPCILPILPFILSGSVDQKRMKPYGIITGFVLSFTLFAFLSRKLVLFLDIDPEIIKYASIALLILFGLTLISETLSLKFSQFTQRFVNIGNKIPCHSSDGYLNGILIGALIGLVWTPCAGPILASVIVQIIRQESDYSALLLLLSFSIGTGIPMLIITLSGRKIMSKLSFLNHHTPTIRKIFGVLIILSSLYIGFGNQVSASEQSMFTSSQSKNLRLEDGLFRPYDAPELKGITTWLNSNPLTLKSLKGKVVLIDFWTYSCINCIRTLPHITEWDQKYKDKGLVIIGIHAPEFEFEKKKDNVVPAIKAHNIQYPVALDNNFDTWLTYENRYWPAHYLINREGKVVYTHFGEGNYDITENNIRYLLGINDANSNNSSTLDITDDQSPETYLGLKRADREVEFGKKIPLHHWSINNRWKRNKEFIESTDKNAELIFHTYATKVFLVMDTVNNMPIEVNIQIKEKNAKKFIDLKTITVNQATLYNLADLKVPQDAYIKIIPNQAGLKAFAFTFG